jgi:hypothetical protein
MTTGCAATQEFRSLLWNLKVFAPFFGWSGTEPIIPKAIIGLLYQPWIMDDE